MASRSVHDAERTDRQRPFRTDIRLLRKDGSSFPVEGGAPTFLYRGTPHELVVVRDMTARVAAEQQLREREAEYRGIFEATNDGLIIGDLEGRIVEANPASCRMFGYTRNELIGLDADQLAAPDDRPAIAGARRELDAGGLYQAVARAYQHAVGEQMDGLYAYVRCFLAVPLTLKGQVIGALTLEHSQPGFYAQQHLALAMAIAQQAAIAIENARLYQRAREIAVLEERQRLSRELHDSVSQALYSIALGAKTARALLDPDSRAIEPVEFALMQAERGLAEMRALIFELRPGALEQDGLVAALQRQADAVQARQQCALTTVLCAEPDAPLPVKEAVYRIAQEALHNTVKHGHARSMELRLDDRADGLTLEVRDDGAGFDMAGTFPGHLGLHTMRERAARLGGTLEAVSAPGAGTHVRAHIPLQSRRREEG